MKRRLLLSVTVSAALSASLLGAVGLPAAHAQAPATPVTLVVPFPPGGTMDNLARKLAHDLSEQWKQTVIIDNKPGAGTTIGTAQVARAAADGRTLGMVANSFAINASLLNDLRYDTRKDFTPVALVAYTPHVLVARKGLQVASLNDVLALARKSPGKLTFASFGTGTSPHLAIEMLKTEAKVDVVHVAYKGQAPALNDLLGEHVDFMFTNLPDVLPHIAGGRLTAVAVADEARAPSAPMIPTFAEAGMPGFLSNSWFGVIAPANLDAATLQRLSQSVVAVAKQPAFQEHLTSQGLQPAARDSKAFGEYLNAEIDKAAKLIKQTDATR